MSDLRKAPTKTVETYFINGNELRVMVDLLERAAKSGSLTDDQQKALAYDPMDIVVDLKEHDIYSAHIFISK